MSQQVPQHAVEGGAQLLELVAGVNVGPLLDVAAGGSRRSRRADVRSGLTIT